MSEVRRAPRCPKCGKAPPIRRATLGEADVKITHRCQECGTKYEIATDDLAMDADVAVSGQAG